MKKALKLLCFVIAIIAIIGGTAGCNLFDSNDGDDEKVAINKPIESISIHILGNAIDVGESISISATIEPADTDDSIVWTSRDENIAYVKDGVLYARSVGDTGIYARAKNGDVSAAIEFRVMPKSTGVNDLNTCASIANSAILTITKKNYNKNWLGITTKSVTKTFKAVIFKQVGSTYYYIAGYDNFKEVEGYDYQEVTARDSNGDTYEIHSVRYSTMDGTQLAVGFINSNDQSLGVLPIGERGYYYQKERLYIKDGSSFISTYAEQTECGLAETTAAWWYSDSLLGSPVLDCKFKFVGLVIGEDHIGRTKFVAAWKLRKVVDSMNI